MTATYERRLAFEGAANFRDLGGYPAGGGRRTRWRRLFRADSLADLTPTDLERLDVLGLRGLVDFRIDIERALKPNRLPKGSAIRTLEIGFLPVGALDVLGRVRSGAITAADLDREVQGHYRRFVTDHADEYRRAVAFAADVSAGRSVVLVRAVMGVAVKAADILDGHNPLPGAHNQKEFYTSSFDGRTPFSSVFGLPLLMKDATPFSRFWNMPALARAASPLSTWLNIPTLWNKPSSDTSWFGTPKLLRGTGSFSSFFNLPVLLKAGRPFSEFWHAPELSREATPFAVFFRIPSLINQPGWNSEVDGVPKLMRNAMPFSNLLGLRGLARSGDTTFPSSGVSRMSDKPSVFSSMLGLPTVSSEPRTTSSLFGIPLLLSKRGRGK